MTTVPVKSLSVEWWWMDVVAPTWQMAGVGVLGSLGGVWAQVQHIIRSETPASIGATTTLTEHNETHKSPTMSCGDDFT